MYGTVESGLEVNPPENLELPPQPDPNKYCMEGPVSCLPDCSTQPQAKTQARLKNSLVLAVIAIACLAAGLGAGLGAGLAAQHKSTSPRDASINGAEPNNASTTVTTSTPSTLPSTVCPATNGAEPNNACATVTTSTPSALPSAVCPATNGSTYIATNKPLPTIAPTLGWSPNESFFSFEILCNTNLAAYGSVMDIQLITNVSSLKDCLDACALYSFQTWQGNFPAYACTGVAWGSQLNTQQVGDPWPICWLKSGVTLETAHYAFSGTCDGAVLLL